MSKHEDAELIDLLATNTNRLTQIMMNGECCTGEYELCKKTIELLQHEIFLRSGYNIETVIRENYDH